MDNLKKAVLRFIKIVVESTKTNLMGQSRDTDIPEKMKAVTVIRWLGPRVRVYCMESKNDGLSEKIAEVRKEIEILLAKLEEKSHFEIYVVVFTAFEKYPKDNDERNNMMNKVQVLCSNYNICGIPKKYKDWLC